MVLLFCMTIVGSWAAEAASVFLHTVFLQVSLVSCEKRFLHRMVVSGESHSYMVAGL